MVSYLPAALVFTGLLIHVAALAPLRRLIAMLKKSVLRTKWLVMAAMLFIFIAGYLNYLMMLWRQQTEPHELTIPLIFLFGALFVWLTISLSLQTAADLQGMDLLKSENVTDPLTRVFNRRYLDIRLDEEVARAKRYSHNLSILMLDIDHFKRVNDTYGHQAGDVTLTTLCTLVKADLRNMDVVARYGGEEFIVICTDTPIEGAMLVAERLRHLIESHPVEISDESGALITIQISASIGAAGLDTGIDSKEKLIRAADQALYHAKEQGRNRVVAA